MVVGILTVELFLGEAASLKDKRRVLKSLLEKIKSRYNVSIAEVDRQDSWNFSTVGVTFVSNDKSHVYRMLNSVLSFIENSGTVEVVNAQTEVI